MKRKLCIVSITVLIMFCLAITSMADVAVKKQVSFNDDFTKLYYNGKTFSRFDANSIDYDYDDLYLPEEDYEFDDGVYAYSPWESDFDVVPNKNHTNVADIYVYSNYKENIFFATIDYKDGSTLTCSFLRDDYRAEYDRITSGKADVYTVDFSWYETYEVQIEAKHLKTGKNEQIDYNFTTDYDVYIEANDKSFRYCAGILMDYNGSFYYFDFAEAGITYSEYIEGYDLYENKITARLIEDTETIEALNEGKEIYNEDSGFIFDDDFAVGISKLFFGILLLLVPFVICIGSLVLFIKSKKPIYKKIFATICVLSLLVIITTVIIIIQYNKTVTV